MPRISSEYFPEFIRIALLDLCMNMSYALCTDGTKKKLWTLCMYKAERKKTSVEWSIKIGNKMV